MSLTKLRNVLFIAIAVLLTQSLSIKTFQNPAETNKTDNQSPLKNSSEVPASTLKDNKCFLDTVDNSMKKLSKLIDYYSSLCSLDKQPLFQPFIEAVKLLGNAEGNARKSQPIKDDDIAQLVSISSKYSFSSSLSSLKGKLSSNQKEFDEILQKIKQEVEKIGTEHHYPTFFLENIWRLITYIRIRQIYDQAYSDKSACLDIVEKDISTLDVLTNDPSEQSELDKCKEKIEDSLTINPFDFERGGIAVAVWVLEDHPTIVDDVPVIQGYISNIKVFELLLRSRSDYTISNMITINQETFELVSQSKCSEYAFILLAIENDCDKYKLTVSIRFSTSNHHISDSRPVSAEFVEGLKLNFLKPPVLNVKEYKPFHYSHNEVLRIMFSQTHDIFQNLQQLTSKCQENPSCSFYSTAKGCICPPGFSLVQGKCTETCPDKTIRVDGKCVPFLPGCKEANEPKKCLKCEDGFFKYKDECLSTCPAGTFPQQSNDFTCSECSSNCQSCKNKEKCLVCQSGFYLTLDSKCTDVCPEGTYMDQTSPLWQCLPCSNCDSCTGPKNCKKCKQGLYLKKGICVEKCEDGFFPDETSKTCKECIPHCKFCNNEKECIKCEASYFKTDEKTCVSDCDCGQTSFNGICIDCFDKDRCAECDPNNTQTCLKCNDPYYLKEGKCVDKCLDFFYANNDKKECAPCVPHCQVCNKDTCLFCATGHYLFEGKECRSNCPDGYIISANSICLKCDKKCKKCLEQNLDICTECYSGAILQEGRCVDKCDDNYFVNESRKCEKCQLGCDKCQNRFTCDICSIGFSKKGDTCVDQCGDGYISNRGTCEACTVNKCQTCDQQDKTHCLLCTSPLVLFGNTCYEKCPPKTYQTDTTCSNCPKDCDECLNSSICITCTSPKKLQKGECKEKCDDGYFEVERNCNPCNCKKCSGNPNKCTECGEGLYLFENTCVATCPLGNYPDGGSCSPCPKECKECTDKDTCTLCQFGFSLSDKKCTDKCPSGSVNIPEKQKCEKCTDYNDGCLKCLAENISICIQCPEDKVLIDGDCKKECPPKFHVKNGECEHNPNDCEIAIDKDKCEKCDKDYYLKNGQCVKDCGDSFVASEGKCIPCQGNCKKCRVDNTSFCTECFDLQKLLDGSCLTTCPDRYWDNKGQCMPCAAQNCLECIEKGKTCKKCQNGLVLDENICKPKPCEDGKVEVNGECFKCEVPNCKVCPSTNTKICTECKEDTFMLSQLKCDTECPVKTFKNKETKSCDPCVNNCLICDNSTTCKTCDGKFVLQDRLCEDKCKLGYREINNSCQQCPVSDCISCPSGKCIECKDPLYLHDNTCNATCGDGTYPDNNMPYTCKKCPDLCTKCEGPGKCTECKNNHPLNDGICEDTCPDNKVQILSKCEQCQTSPDCKKCTANDLTTCTECKSNLLLRENKCVSTCTPRYYPDGNICKPCSDKCLTCIDDKTCMECEKDFYLYNNECKPTCPLQYYKENGHCRPCGSLCDDCTSDECKKCKEGYLLEEGKCVKPCSIGYYQEKFDKCLKCGDCLTCKDRYTCDTCIVGKYLLNGQCVYDCGSGYAKNESTHECAKCTDNCEKCFPESVGKCEICQDGYYKLDGKCIDVCPKRFFKNQSAMTCDPCLDKCEVCADNHSCGQCEGKLVYFPEENKCVENCPDEHRLEGRECKRCKVLQCKKCPDRIDICEVCNESLLNYEKISCGTVCPTDYYRDWTLMKCIHCDSGCKTCTEKDNCKECLEDWTLENGQCKGKCTEGSVSVNRVCEPCKTENCAICSTTDLNVCQKCKENKKLKEYIENGVVKYKCAEHCDINEGEFEKDGIMCKKCIDKCAICEDDVTCKKCYDGKVLQGTICQDACDSGYVERNGKCLPCHVSDCDLCDNLTQEICKKCKGTKKLKNNICDDQCGDGFLEIKYSTDFIVCLPCISNCSKCSNSNTCDQCNIGFLLQQDGTCIPESQCINNLVKVEDQCKKCTQPTCKVCSSNNVNDCSECSENNYLSDSNKCVPNCGERYYQQMTPIRACKKCTDNNCLECAPENICSRCANQMKILNFKCEDKCPSGFYADSFNFCKECDDSVNCKICNPNDPTKCKECAKGFLDNGKCVTKCPNGTYADSENECQPCDAKCELCSNALTCDICKSPTYKRTSDNQCVTDCPKGWVPVNGVCEKCLAANCNICESTNLEKCIECNNEKEGKLLYQSQCRETCPTKTYTEGRNCIDCEDNCDKCLDKMTCTDCTYPFVEYKGDCSSDCKDGFVNVNAHCKECEDQERCVKCESDLKTCIKCKDDLKLAEGKCIVNCDAGKYYDQTERKCMPCLDNCIECINSTSCKTCHADYFWNQADETCTKKCSEQHYGDRKTQTCTPCPNQKCRNCDPGSPESCTECPLLGVKFLMQNQDTKLFECVDKCPDMGYYLEDNTCKKCSPSCKTCSSYDFCTSCNDDSSLEGTQCVSQCKPGTVSRGGICYACQDPKCEICEPDKLHICLKCFDGIVFDNVCLSGCPDGYYYSDISKKCEKCEKNCKKCTATECIDCADNFYFLENTKHCVKCEKPNLLIDNICFPCKVAGCIECQSYNPFQCKQCDSPQFLYDHKCVGTCPDGYFPSDHICEKCDENCMKCSGKKQCSICKDTFINYLGECMNKCPPYYGNNGQGSCERCIDSDCKECESDLKTCKECDKKILFNGTCKEECPSRYYKTEENKCEQCGSNCKECNAETCVQCDPDVKKQGKDCVARCDPGYYDSGKECIQCTDERCIQCNPFNFCEKCRDPSYLIQFDGKCTSICPEGTFANKETNTCEDCKPGCEKCINGSTCIKCLDGYLKSADDCVHTCPAKTTKLKGECVPCVDPDCNECKPENPDECTQCQKKPLYHDKCLDTCPPETYLKGSICADCDPKCAECINDSICTKCKPGFNLSNNMCVNPCPDGKVLIGSDCVPCSDEQCQTCTMNVKDCIQCYDPKKLMLTDCVTDCREGYYDPGDRVCRPCQEGCHDCDNTGKCTSCLTGYYLFNSQCLKDCPKKCYGDCTKNECSTCHPACQECVGPTSENCIGCAIGYFLNLKKDCVKPEACVEGTYPNTKTGNCEPCKFPYCLNCDADKCTKCNPGYQLNNGKCDIPVNKKFIVKDITLYDPYTFDSAALRAKEVIPITSVGSIGVKAADFSISFWIRMLSHKIYDDVVVLNINNDAPEAYNFKFIIEQTGRCALKVLEQSGVKVYKLKLDDCSYESLYNWQYYTIIIDKLTKQSMTVTVYTFDDQRKLLDYVAKFNIKQGITAIIANTATIQLNDQFVSTIKDNQAFANPSGASFQLYGGNLYDYSPVETEIQYGYTIEQPPNCDYFCTSCSKTCQKCVDNIPPLNGYCTAQKIDANSGIVFIDTPWSFNLRQNIQSSLTSDAYGVATWFYMAGNEGMISASGNILTANYAGQGNQFSQNSFTISVDKGNLIFHQFKDYPITLPSEIKLNIWYLIVVGIQKGIVHISITSKDNALDPSKDMKATQEIPTEHFVRLFDDYQFTFGSNWVGSIFNTDVYLNNVPGSGTLDIMSNDIAFPKNCIELTKSATCGKCIEGFMLLDDGTCVDNATKKVVTLIPRIDLWNGEQKELPISQSPLPEEYSISLWLRKKTHSNMASIAEHSIVSLRTTEGDLIPLISETIQPEFVSDISLHWGEKAEKYKHTFDKEVYEYIHVVMIFSTKKKTLTYSLKDFSQTGKTLDKTDDFAFKDLANIVIGDINGQEVNFEVSFVNFYQIKLLNIHIDTIRKDMKPIDCDPACKDCDLSTGTCRACGKAGEINTPACSVFLMGFDSGYVFSFDASYPPIINTSSYIYPITKSEFTSGVNSLNYAVFGLARVFDFYYINQGSDTRYRVLSVSNKGKLENYEDLDMGKDLIVVDIVKTSTTSYIEFMFNAGGKMKKGRIENYQITPMKWFTIHAGIDVKAKTAKFVVVDKNTGNIYKGSVTFDEYPEKLQEIGALSSYGYKDSLNDPTYVAPNLQIRNLYLSPNIGYSEEMLTKYNNKFYKNFPTDPGTCPMNCLTCQFSGSYNKCIICEVSFYNKDGECFEEYDKTPMYPYVILSDTFIVKKTEYSLALPSLFTKSFTLGFYLRKNYLRSDYKNEIDIIKKGGLTISLLTNNPSEMLIVKNTNERIEIDIGSVYDWNLIIVAVDPAVGMYVTAINEKKVSERKQRYKEVKMADLDKTISVDTNDNEVQIYGLTITSGARQNPLLEWPNSDCEYDCFLCTDNVCRACDFGRDGSDNCIKRPIMLTSAVYNRKKPPVYEEFASYIAPKKPLRTNKFAVEYMFNLLQTGTYTIFTLTNGEKAQYPSSPTIEIKYSSEGYFDLSYTNREGIFKQSNQSIRINYPIAPTNSQHYVAVSVNDKTIDYLFSNTKDNFVSGTVDVKGGMDYLTNRARLYYITDDGINPGGDIVAYVIKALFHYDNNLSISRLQSYALAHSRLVQGACIEGSRSSCTKCFDGKVPVAGVCVPVPESAILLKSNIINVSRLVNFDNTIKLPSLNSSKSLVGFTLSFWWKINAALTSTIGILDLVTSDEQVLKVFYSPDNSLIFKASENEQLIVPSLFDAQTLYEWVHITLVYDFQKGILNANAYVASSKKKLSIEKSVTPRKEISKMLMLKTGFEDTAVNAKSNVSFSLYLIQVIPNYYYTAQEMDNYRPEKPMRCRTICKEDCVKGVCPEGKEIVGNINLIDSTVVMSLNETPLFSFVDTEGVTDESFTYYLISLDIDVTAYKKGEYGANSNVFMLIHSDNRMEYDNLSMNDVIPNSLTNFGALSLVNNNGQLFLMKGYLPWEDTIEGIQVNLGQNVIADYSRIYLTILIDVLDMKCRIFAIADDVIYSTDGGRMSLSAPISFYSLVYHHPVVTKMNLNLFAPRVDKDLYDNASQHMSIQYSSGYCTSIDAHCLVCLKGDISFQKFCIKCKEGYSLYNGWCSVSSNEKKNETATPGIQKDSIGRLQLS